MTNKNKYTLAYIIALALVVAPFFISLFWPGPLGIDAPLPEYWPLVKEIELGLVFLGATIIWVTNGISYVYSEKIRNVLSIFMFFIPLLVFLPISVAIFVGRVVL